MTAQIIDLTEYRIRQRAEKLGITLDPKSDECYLPAISKPVTPAEIAALGELFKHLTDQEAEEVTTWLT
jgi:hypothetical protein